MQSVKLDCGRWSLRKVTFWGEWLVNRVIWVFFLSYGFFTWQLIRELLCILIFSNFAFKKCCDLFFTFGFLWKVFVTFFYIGLMNNWLKLFLKGLQCMGWFSGQNLRKQFLLKRQGLLKRYLGLEKRNSQRRCRENVLEHAVGVIRYLNWHLPVWIDYVWTQGFTLLL